MFTSGRYKESGFNFNDHPSSFQNSYLHKNMISVRYT